MAINYADKHAQQIDERFTAGSITEAVVNKDYDFVGVKTVKVHSVPTVSPERLQTHRLQPLRRTCRAGGCPAGNDYDAGQVLHLHGGQGQLR